MTELAGANFEAELRRELAEGHPLFGVDAKAIAKSQASDDILFSLTNGCGKVAMVHLTWSSRQETSPWPQTDTFNSLFEFIRALDIPAGGTEGNKANKEEKPATDRLPQW